ncbi:TAT-variant-translocated molybdopterin oxidoreductase [Flammeovirgaceae bacterium SG7u.111]|nr:TAT-variant-translocated molybdopterin oxidoreductase [Flammeovirgaceae bacterium SG7u.132]WPO36671.1 TAT-variant-translocated molybdopterin oxidoreductase [Flammeovirgaceae bacterium SG7u.111]
MKNRKTYWKGVEELKNDPGFVQDANKEFPAYLPIKDAYGDNSTSEEESGSNRRDFLKLMGFSVAAVSLAACETPVKKAIPYLNKPEDVDPGIPNYYASTYVDGGEAYPVVVKTREGRPIFVEGNGFSSITKGGTNARINASVMSLYDNEKIKYPTKSGEKTDWATIDKEISQQLASIAAAGQPIVIVSNTVTSPTTKKLIAEFAAKYPTVKHVTYDQDSAYGILEANKSMFGKAVVPSYSFDKADVIVSFGADFLENWISGVEFSHQYATTRKIGKDKKHMSRHFQFEANLSLTGSNADYRTPVKASAEGLAVAKLFNLVAKGTGNASVSAADVEVKNLDKAAADLLKSKGHSLVVSSSNDPAVQLMVNQINQMLGNYGTTLDINTPSFQKQGNDKEMAAFVADLEAGRVGGVFFYNANPVYDHPLGAKISAAISKAKLSVATADRLDETASKVTYNCPDSHFLEAWNDAEIKKGFFSLGQPTISTIFSYRQFQEGLLKWSGSNKSFHDYLKASWEAEIFPLQTKETEFEKFWQRALHDGVVELKNEEYTSIQEGEANEPVAFSAASVSSALKKYTAGNSGVELVVYMNSILGNGTFANNPFIHETPDPISKVCWGHYVAVSQSLASEKGFTKVETKVSVAKVSAGGVEVELPVVIQPGLESGTIAIAAGYGRDKAAGKVAAEAGGVNAYPFVKSGDFIEYAVTEGVSIENTGSYTDIAQTQTHQTLVGRTAIVQESTLAAYKKDPRAGREDVHISTYSGERKPGDISLWNIPEESHGEHGEEKGEKSDLWADKLGAKAQLHEYPLHHWGMTIDLNACTGCSACVTACHIENNVPVVGKKEIVNKREMHWLRIDRYYSSPDGAESNDELMEAADNPEVVYQPMMCQHCNNAPCETVCPVAATTHSSEGLNQMTYNRCVGTKYCANNCPYKVRRFNWFKYHNNDEFDYNMNNDLGKMVLNPDVTVRSRGVMEKCSMCVQRTQLGKLKAKMAKRPLKDGDATTACASACSTGAITFGDLNDTKSEIRQLTESELPERAYNVLDELNVRPNIWYLTKIRNKDEGQA